MNGCEVSPSFFSLFHSPPFFPLSFTSFLPPFLTLPQVCYCHVPFLLVLIFYFAPEPEAGRTHTDEVGRSTAASPTLSPGASTKERWREGDCFSADVDQQKKSYLFLSALSSTLLLLSVTSVLSHGSHGPCLAAEGGSILWAHNFFDWFGNFTNT